MVFGAKWVQQKLGVDGEGIKFVLPHAPVGIVTGNRNARMNTWFDCYSFDIENRAEDEEGLYRSAKWINTLIDIEERECKIPSHRIIVGGFSQGGAVAWMTGLTTKRKLAGLFILSSYVPLRRKVEEFASPISKTLPIWWGHGTHDAQVQYEFSMYSAQKVASDVGIEFVRSKEPLTPQDAKEDKEKVRLRFASYEELGHWFDDQELNDLAVWMKTVLSGSD
ncbi:acyl-protein thioesterase 1 [Coprinopsis cinerea okayama7|uniref:Acyl-protein thioesterase 1 n=1 Tax=Coprinopsis cinerea (strain Okayama-7 / 130 / ATCC MYA-4618 / FGSC 9003) TaxID=240176 RepID=A8N7D7_COPC7|nr:acyl-protein thioesterase 1 [Coprinopsis cinerea okayama7\|eukprot:XP_001830743.2 acyl-protein thioesterase 1 [Coprinopsis cinerea okayama7\